MTIWIYTISGIIVVNLPLLFNKEVRETWTFVFCDFPKEIINDHKKKKGIKKIEYLSCAIFILPFLFFISFLLVPVAPIENFYRKLKYNQKVKLKIYKLKERKTNYTLIIWETQKQLSARTVTIMNLLHWLYIGLMKRNHFKFAVGYQCQSSSKFYALYVVLY